MTPFPPFRVSVYREEGPLHIGHDLFNAFWDMDRTDRDKARKGFMSQVLYLLGDAYDCGVVAERLRAARELRSAKPPEPAEGSQTALSDDKPIRFPIMLPPFW